MDVSRCGAGVCDKQAPGADRPSRGTCEVPDPPQAVWTAQFASVGTFAAAQDYIHAIHRTPGRSPASGGTLIRPLAG